MSTTVEPLPTVRALTAGFWRVWPLAGGAAVLAVLLLAGRLAVDDWKAVFDPLVTIAHAGAIAMTLALVGQWLALRKREGEQLVARREKTGPPLLDAWTAACESRLGRNHTVEQLEEALRQTRQHLATELDRWWLACYWIPMMALPVPALLAGLRSLRVSIDIPPSFFDLFAPLVCASLELLAVGFAAAMLRNRWNGLLDDWYRDVEGAMLTAYDKVHAPKENLPETKKPDEPRQGKPQPAPPMPGRTGKATGTQLVEDPLNPDGAGPAFEFKPMESPQ